MRRAGVILALSGLTLLAACGDNQPALPPVPEKQEKLTRFQFKVDGALYALSLPERATMRDASLNGVIFYASGTQRLQRTMTLTSIPRHSDQGFDREHVMRDARGKLLRDPTDRTVRYRQLGKTGAGSGGAVEDIAGQIRIGEKILFFECSDQSEGVIRADWCLDYIDSLEIITPPASGNG